MASYNGLVASTIIAGNTAFAAGTSTFGVTYTVPSKFFSHGQFAAQVTGISGTLGVQILGAVGGATFVIAGRTNVSAVGNFPIPLITYVGTSGTFQNTGIPRPSLVIWQGAGLGGTTNQIGLTASVFLAGEYN